MTQEEELKKGKWGIRKAEIVQKKMTQEEELKKGKWGIRKAEIVQKKESSRGKLINQW